MTKNVGLTYVKDFEFPAEQGFTGSAGKNSVRGYYRGGPVKKDPVKAAAQKPRAPGPGASHGGQVLETARGTGGVKKARARRKSSGAGMPKNVKARGGEVGVTTKQSKDMPQKASQKKYAAKSAAKNRGGKMEYNEGGSVHDKLKAEGAKMGYAYGGTVKNTSAEFVEKRSKQDTMDNANYPSKPKSNQRDVESGTKKKLRPRFKKGGGVHHVRDISTLKASKKGMPKGVKAHGGLAKYAAGGYAAGGTKKGQEAGSGIALTLGRIQEQIAETEDLLQESAAASKLMTKPSAAVSQSATRPSLADDPDLQVTPSTANEAAKARSRSEPSIEQTGVGEDKEPTFGRPMRPVMHVEARTGGPVSAAKGGRKKSGVTRRHARR